MKKLIPVLGVITIVMIIILALGAALPQVLPEPIRNIIDTESLTSQWTTMTWTTNTTVSCSNSFNPANGLSYCSWSYELCPFQEHSNIFYGYKNMTYVYVGTCTFSFTNTYNVTVLR